MKTNNRPMVKEIKDIDMGYAGREVIEVKRPMNDTEYIKYLEKELNKCSCKYERNNYE